MPGYTTLYWNTLVEATLQCDICFARLNFIGIAWHQFIVFEL